MHTAEIRTVLKLVSLFHLSEFACVVVQLRSLRSVLDLNIQLSDQVIFRFLRDGPGSGPPGAPLHNIEDFVSYSNIAVRLSSEIDTMLLVERILLSEYCVTRTICVLDDEPILYRGI